MLESLFNNVAGLQAKTPRRCFPLSTFFKTPPVADSALTYDLNGLKSRVNRHLLSFLNIFPIRFLSFSFSITCNSMPCSGCSALYGFNPDQKKDRNTESVNKFKPNFFH